MRVALLGLRQPQRVLRAGSPRLFVDKPSGTHLTYHPGRTGGSAAASLGPEGRIITLPSFTRLSGEVATLNAQLAKGERQHALPLWLHGTPRRRRRPRNAAPVIRNTCRRVRRRGEDTERQTHTPTEGDVGRPRRGLQTSTRAENRSGADLFGI